MSEPTGEPVVLTLWTIYRNPSDFPGKWVLRGHDIGGPADSEPASIAHPDCVVADTLEQARAAVPPGLACIPRSESDDPTIVEVWL